MPLIVKIQILKTFQRISRVILEGSDSNLESIGGGGQNNKGIFYNFIHLWRRSAAKINMQPNHSNHLESNHSKKQPQQDFIDPQHFMLRQLNKANEQITEESEQQAAIIPDLVYNFIGLKEKAEHLRQISEKLYHSLQAKATKQSEKPEFFVENVKIFRRAMDEDVLGTANKLKVMCGKSLLLGRQTTHSKYLHLHPTYIDSIRAHHKACLDVDYEKNREKVYKQLEKIKKKFKITHPNFLHFYRHHPSQHLEMAREPLPAFYVSFYNQHLLFFNDQPLSFNSNLLFCPIILSESINAHNQIEQTISLSPWYLDQLFMDNISWENFTIFLIFKDKIKMQNKYITKVTVNKQQKHKEQLQKDLTAHLLKKIRAYVYLKTVWNWMNHICQERSPSRERRSITINVNPEISFQMTMVNPKPFGNVQRYRKQLKRKESLNYSNKSQKEEMQPEGNDPTKEDPAVAKMIAHDFLSFFSAKKMKEKKMASREECEQELKFFLRHLLKRLELKPDSLGEYQGPFRYFYNSSSHREPIW